MNHLSSTVTDLVAEAERKPPSVSQRLDKRLEVLRTWLQEGVPFGKAIPVDLKAARIWNDEALRIFKISSPNDFTTTHPLNGARVRDIARLLTELTKRFGKPTTRSKPNSSAAVTKFDRSALNLQLQSAVSQWHSERDQRLSETRRAEASEARNLLLAEEIHEREKLISDLRVQMSERHVLKAVK